MDKETPDPVPTPLGDPTPAGPPTAPPMTQDVGGTQPPSYGSTPAAPVTVGVAIGAAVPLVPPPGAPAGGTWVSEKYNGVCTFALVFLFYFLIGIYSFAFLLCPMDERNVYLGPDGIKYNVDGSILV